jgi:hypothetical protein
MALSKSELLGHSEVVLKVIRVSKAVSEKRNPVNDRTLCELSVSIAVGAGEGGKWRPCAPLQN